MSWRNASLVDLNYSVEVDTSKLEERLDEIEQKLTGIDSDEIAQKVQEAVDGLELTTDDKVREIFSEMAHDEGERLIQDTVSNMDYVTSEDVAQQIRDADLPDENRVSAMIDDALDSSDFVDRDGVLEILRDEGLDTDGVADAADVETLQRDVADLARRFEIYAGKVDAMSIQGVNESITKLESDVHDDNEAIIKLTQRMQDAEYKLAALEGSNETAVTFFGLIQKAFDLLMQGRRGA